MIVAISGTTGFIGGFIVRSLQNQGMKIKELTRATFDLPDKEFIENFIEGTDVVINLAGSPVSRRWTPSAKQDILESRISTTRKISNAIRESQSRPKLFISTSAIGIYNNAETHSETSNAFSGSFLGQVCHQWEEEANRAEQYTRVVIFRIGVVLGEDGGALKKMFLPFSIGAGGKLGNGRQPVSFIHIQDLSEAMLFTINKAGISGVVNAVAPYPSDNAEFTDKLGKVLGKPAFLQVPEGILKLIYGEGATVLLEGQRVIPEKLLTAGFRFRYPTIQNALVQIYR